MAQPAMRVTAAMFVIGLLAILTTGLAPVGVVGAENSTDDAEWREYEVDATFDIEPEEGMTEAEVERMVDRAMVRVEALRSAEFQERPVVHVMSREEAQKNLGSGGTDLSPESRAFLNAKMGGLFFVDYETDAAGERSSNLNVTTGGYYLIDRNELVIIYEGEHVVVDELILAHELLHAWQDQRFGLGPYQGDTLDGEDALLALIEGDAVFLETLYEERCATEWECVQPEADEGGEESGEAPRINWGIFFTDFQPYSDGPAFVQRAHNQGGWEAVNALYDDPPTSARHVIEPETYGTFEPTEIDLTDSHRGDWTRLRPSNGRGHLRFGQARIAAMFQQTWWLARDHDAFQSGDAPVSLSEVINCDADGCPARIDAFNYDLEVVTGWTGDRFHAYRRGSAVAWVWRIGWESPSDAETFASGYEELLEFYEAEEVHSNVYRIDSFGYEGAYAVVVNGTEVTVAYAPSVADLPNVSAETANAVGLDRDERGEQPRISPAAPVDTLPRSADSGTTDSEPSTQESTDSEPPVTNPLPGFGPVAALASLVIAGRLARRYRDS